MPESRSPVSCHNSARAGSGALRDGLCVQPGAQGDLLGSLGPVSCHNSARAVSGALQGDLCVRTGGGREPSGGLGLASENKEGVRSGAHHGASCISPVQHKSNSFKKAIKFVEESTPSYFSPYDHIFESSNVEHGLESMFSLESIGIRDEDLSNYDDKQIDKFTQSIELKQNKYWVCLPWKEDVIDKVPSNYHIARQMAVKVTERNKVLGVHEKYKQVFVEQSEMDIIEEIPHGYEPEQHIWIPHRPVIKEDPLVTTKVRPVFNCSLKVGGKPSLNEAAYPGIDLMNNLTALLNYFRQNNIVVLSDIRKAFLMIKLKLEEDKNRFSFLLYDNNKFIAYRYTTIIFGFIASPFILNYIIKYHICHLEDVVLKTALNQNFYVDNFMFTCNEPCQALEMYQKSKQYLATGGLDLCEWQTNSLSVREKFLEADCAKSDEAKVLGYNFNTLTDTLEIKTKTLDPNANTKRKILSSISQIFDPIGFLSPFMVGCKIILRKLNEMKLQWDQPVGTDIERQWFSICENFSKLSELKFQRMTFDASLPLNLFVFCDASKVSYGFACYSVQGESSNLLFSKLKIAPIASKTLPTLELLAIYLAILSLKIYLKQFYSSKLQINNIQFFTDSQVALSWILKGSALKNNVFVNNRLKDIKETLTFFADQNINIAFDYVPTENNIADILTRPNKASDFVGKFNEWTHGPNWICARKDCWPQGNLGSISPNFIKTQNPLIASAVVSVQEPVIDTSRYSSLSKALSVTRTVLQAGYKFQNKTSLDYTELQDRAYSLLIKQSQSCSFQQEIAFLKSDDKNLPIPKLISDLNLFLDDKGILRSKGRIQKCLAASYGVINPVVMHKTCPLTKLIILDAHSKCNHLGVGSTINYLRNSGWWIPKIRQAVSTSLRTCSVCRLMNSKGFKKPTTPALPSAKCNFLKPFETVDVDYTGHFFTVDASGNKLKTYILLFTCFTSRAVHLEMVNYMNLDEFVLAFIRFTNRYGVPSTVYSDNAKTFIAGRNLLDTLHTSDIFKEKFATTRISFKTIPIYAAWFGATWERLMKTVKDCLYKSFGKYALSSANFSTALTDIQLAINNRPLSYINTDDNLNVITPNHLVSPGVNFPSVVLSDQSQEHLWDCDNEEDYRASLVASLETRDKVFSKFQNLWFQQYLLALRENHKQSFDHKNYEQSPFLKRGSVVLHKHPTKAKPYWSLAIIIDLIESPDDRKIRTVRIRRSDGSEVVASIVNLYPLELNANFEQEELGNIEQRQTRLEDPLDDSGDPLVNDSAVQVPVHEQSESDLSSDEDAASVLSDNTADNDDQQRPRRRAAQNFSKKLKSWIKSDLV